MSYCINPQCCNFNNLANQGNCASCGPDMLLQERYRVIQRLGKGGFGQTFEVEDVRGTAGGGSRKVLKVLLIDDQKAVELFQREARVLNQLEHPGIPKVEADGYLVVLNK